MEDTGTGKLVVLAVDDEEPALDELTDLLRQHPAVGTVLRTTDAAEALRIVDGVSGVDAIFVDVRMRGLDGMELARRCSRRVAAPAVVFVTAHETRAVEAYEVGAVDYLLKPVRSERLGASLRRLRAVAPSTGSTSAARDDVIPVELAGNTTLVARGAVRCVVAQGDYARLHTDAGSHLVRVPLSVLEERWGEAGFVRVHRSYLVALSAVTALRTVGKEHVLELVQGPWPMRVPVSRRRVSAVRRMLRARCGRATA